MAESLTLQERRAARRFLGEETTKKFVAELPYQSASAMLHFLTQEAKSQLSSPLSETGQKLHQVLSGLQEQRDFESFVGECLGLSTQTRFALGIKSSSTPESAISTLTIQTSTEGSFAINQPSLIHVKLGGAGDKRFGATWDKELAAVNRFPGENTLLVVRKKAGPLTITVRAYFAGHPEEFQESIVSLADVNAWLYSPTTDETFEAVLPGRPKKTKVGSGTLPDLATQTMPVVELEAPVKLSIGTPFITLGEKLQLTLQPPQNSNGKDRLLTITFQGNIKGKPMTKSVPGKFVVNGKPVAYEIMVDHLFDTGPVTVVVKEGKNLLSNGSFTYTNPTPLEATLPPNSPKPTA